MLKIRVTTLPDKGLNIKEELPCNTLNNRLLEAPDSKENRIEFLDPIKVNIYINRLPHGVTVEGQIEACCTQICSRCADSAPNKIVCDIKHLFKYHNNLSGPMPEDDIGINYYSGEHIELGTIIEDLLILKLSPYWHPEDDCSGNCSYCGINQSKNKKAIKLGTQGLGDALKKAGLK